MMTIILNMFTFSDNLILIKELILKRLDHDELLSHVSCHKFLHILSIFSMLLFPFVCRITYIVDNFRGGIHPNPTCALTYVRI